MPSFDAAFPGAPSLDSRASAAEPARPPFSPLRGAPPFLRARIAAAPCFAALRHCASASLAWSPGVFSADLRLLAICVPAPCWRWVPLGLLGTLLGGSAHLLDAAGHAANPLAELVRALGGLVDLLRDALRVRLDGAVRHQVLQPAPASHRDAEHLAAAAIRLRDGHRSGHTGQSRSAREKSALRARCSTGHVLRARGHLVLGRADDAVAALLRARPRLALAG